ncbi:hypothetical protein BDV11DRAFT_87489 [Aspergillus similis]
MGGWVQLYFFLMPIISIPSFSHIHPCPCPLSMLRHTAFLNFSSTFFHCTKSTFANASLPSAPVAAMLHNLSFLYIIFLINSESGYVGVKLGQERPHVRRTFIDVNVLCQILQSHWYLLAPFS